MTTPVTVQGEICFQNICNTNSNILVRIDIYVFSVHLWRHTIVRTVHYVKEKIWAVSVFVRQIQTRALARVESDARIRVCELFLWLKQQKPIQIFRVFSVTNKRCPILPMSLFNACPLSKYSVHCTWFTQAYAATGQWKPMMQIATCLSVLWVHICGDKQGKVKQGSLN